MPECSRFRRKDHVRAQCEFEAATEAQPVHRGDDGQGDMLETVEDRHVVTKAGAQLLKAGIRPGHDVTPKGEVVTFASHKHSTGIAAFYGCDCSSQFVNHLVVDAVLRRAIQDDGSHTIVKADRQTRHGKSFVVEVEVSPGAA